MFNIINVLHLQMKVIHPKYYRHRSGTDPDSHLGRCENGLVSGRFSRTSRKTKSLRKYSNLDFNPKFLIQFSLSFNQKNLQNER